VGDPVLRVEEVTKRFPQGGASGGVTAVDGVSAEIAENEFFALLGPSGCGKTTLLRMIAGFEEPDAGRLLLDGADLVGVKPHRRPLNMMFQSYALFPHMNVEDNVMYGLRMEGVGKAEARRRAQDGLAQVQLSELARRRPAQLSGGQRQRVALARALVKHPRVLLLDEPLSALDRQIRGEMQLELKRLQHEVGITFVIVTHDQEEAMTMADRIAVMRDGHIEQVGAPEEPIPLRASDAGVTLVREVLESRSDDPGTRATARQALVARLSETPPPWVEAWCRAAIGRSLLRDGDADQRRQGIIELLHLPARLGEAHPYLAGIALAESARALRELGDPAGAATLEGELRTRYPSHPALELLAAHDGGAPARTP